MSTRVLGSVVVVLAVMIAAITPALLSAQMDPDVLASQSLRGYGHVFIAYTIAWLIVLGWLFSVARRLGRVERSLER
jgi:CcmD family protein